MRASAAISTSASTQVEAGSTGLGLDRGEVDAVVDAHRHGEVVGEVGGDRVTGLAQGRQHVGQVVLALGVVVGEGGEGGGQGRGGEGVGAGVDLADRELLGRRVAGGLRLDHALDLARRGADHAAVGAGVVELDRQHRRRRARLGVRRQQAGDRLGRDQRHVAGKDEHGFGRLDQRQGGADRAAGAVGHGLDDGLDVLRQARGDVLIRRDDRRHAPRPGLAGRGDRPGDHRAAADWVQHLRQGRAHARALAGRHYQH
jgi:hypothetical protein